MVSALLLAAALARHAVAEAPEDYILFVDPTTRPLHRAVARPDGALWRLVLLEGERPSVRAFELDAEGRPISEVDVGEAAVQAHLVASEREVHGLADWQRPDSAALAARHRLWRTGAASAPACAAPDDTHLEASAPELYAAAFPAQWRTGRLLQLGGLYDEAGSDPARVLLAAHGLRGLAVAGPPPTGDERASWSTGPGVEEVEATLEGGARLLPALGDAWAEVDVVRLEDMPGGCSLLRGLLHAGLKVGMVVMIVNGQFPPPIRYASLSSREPQPAALYGCSLSFALDALRPHGFHLVRYSGPYAAFLHETRMLSELGPRDPDEFACYRGARIWGFRDAFPIDAVRDWFFSGDSTQEIWRRCWGNTSAVAGVAASGPPSFLLHL